ncbi:hypothetical protein SKAU_G00346950 [Synaphobranchus kaupii]|uniref:Uncharacterized protein n=1 Tax=Synaphobranchus kaupii TaxID=118154 RepID=A0A9Q1EJQ4_SYNKA|nr:hypothetical protein SKAU_G00346950 [Synaphobranchus kaupii]
MESGGKVLTISGQSFPHAEGVKGGRLGARLSPLPPGGEPQECPPALLSSRASFPRLAVPEHTAALPAFMRLRDKKKHRLEPLPLHQGCALNIPQPISELTNGKPRFPMVSEPGRDADAPLFMWFPCTGGTGRLLGRARNVTTGLWRLLPPTPSFFPLEGAGHILRGRSELRVPTKCTLMRLAAVWF